METIRKNKGKLVDKMELDDLIIDTSSFIKTFDHMLAFSGVTSKILKLRETRAHQNFTVFS